jgi:hypothetical protein
MREPYGEGLASHTGSESGAWNSRKAAREALTGAQAGRVLSREMYVNQSVDAVGSSGRQHRWMWECEHPSDSARSETPACLETPRARTGRPCQCPARSSERAGWRR